MDGWSLYPSGSQRWFSRLLHSTPSHLIYASTLALYAINLHSYHLDILTGHEGTITGLTPCDATESLIATCGQDQTIRVWDMKRHLEVNTILTTDGSANFQPLDITWHASDPTNLIVCGRRGSLRIYNVNTRKYIYHKLGVDQDVTHLSFNPKNPEILFCVCADSTTIIYNLRKKLVQCKFRFHGARITDFSWDPLSENYMMVAYEDGRLALFDTSAPSTNFLIKAFEPDCRGLGAVSWLRSEPGNFLTGDLHNGVMRMWNVAQSEPSKRFKVRKAGIRYFKVISAAGAGKNEKQQTSSTTEGDNSATNDDRLAISFVDGSVGIFNRKTREMEYITPPGHTETIFDCAFCEQDPNLFATSSYDGNVKIWNIKTQKCIENLLGEENTVIYSLAWHPNNTHIAGALGNGTVWIWDSSNGRVLHQHKLHSSQFVYKVAWNKLDPTLLASTSKDKTCCVFREDGKLIKQFKHPNIVFGVDWCPSDKNLVATGCHDGVVRIFDVSKTENAPIRKLKGHTDSVFNVVWHPLHSNILMSGSNDHTVRVWNLDHPDDACKVLKGHVNNVRALAWNPALPHIALSGSWDGTIRVWDVQREATVSVVPHHHADVYGLSVHPQRPFIYGSSSRDTTIRFWTLEPLFKDILLKAVLAKSLSPVLSNAPISPFDTPEDSNAFRMLCGDASQEVQTSLKLLTEDAEKYEKLFSFFSFPQGSNDLWSMAVASVCGNSRFGAEFTHSKQLAASLDSNAQELESIRMQKYGGGLGSASKEEQLKSAAKIYLSLGNMLKYCDILAEVGEWNTALAVAPSVSLKYWKDLTARYVEFLQEEDQSADLAPFLTATGEADDLIEYFTKRRQFRQATISALRHAQDALPHIPNFESTQREVRDAEHPTPQMLRVCAQRAEHHLKLAQPLSAACCYLAMDEYQQTIRCLMKGDEILHAYAIAQIAGLKDNDAIYTAMANLCEKFALWNEGVEMLQQVKDRNAVAQFMCTVSEQSSAQNEQEMEKRFLRAGIQAPNFYKSQAQEFSKSNPSEAIRFFALAKQHEDAAKLANEQFDALFAEETWDWKSIQECMSSAQCINATKVSEQVRLKLMAYANYIGMQRALWKGYYTVAPTMIVNARNGSRGCDKFSIGRDYLDYMLCVVHSKLNRIEALTLISQVEESNLSDELKDAIKRLRTLVEQSPPSGTVRQSYRNIVIPLGSTLPTRAEGGGRTQSFISKTDAGAPLVTLDNGSVISLAEAIMWNDCIRFSPTMSGEKLHY